MGDPSPPSTRGDADVEPGRQPRADGDAADAPTAGPDDEWPAAAVESTETLDRPMPGFPGPGERPLPPTAPVPPGRGGAQKIPRPFSAR
ncbi:MAG TPA: hypothetical protein VJM49_16385, partial [Acidimicrobiales bacterium]|nr:hypothetical protein [Acidimicrobiales bacterium]